MTQWQREGAVEGKKKKKPDIRVKIPTYVLPTPVYPIQNVTQVSSVIANVKLSATQCPEKCPQKNKRCCVHSMHTAFGIHSTMQCCAFAPEMTDVKITVT